VQRAIVDPDRNAVTALVITTGWLLGRDLLLPVEALERAAVRDDVVRLALTREEIARLPGYVAARYAPAPSGWVPPQGYARYPVGAFLWPAGLSQPASAAPARVTRPARVGRLGIGKGVVVLDRVGDGLGVVDDVLVDPSSGELRRLVVRVGDAARTLDLDPNTATARAIHPGALTCVRGSADSR
jgi:hypothetical protein